MIRMGNIAVFVAGWSSEFQSRFMNGICKRAKAAGYAVSIFTCQAGAEISDKHVVGENQIYSLANLKKFDGIILATHTIWNRDTKEKMIQQVKASGIPAVSLEERVEGLGFIGIDNSNAMIQMLEHVFQKHGYRRMHFVSGPADNYESNKRLQAFLTYAVQHGMSEEECKVWYGDFSLDSGKEIGKQIMKNPDHMPEVVVCANDKMAIGVCAEFKKKGYAIPQDIAVTGYDGVSDSILYIPGITTISRSQEELGLQSCEMLLQQMRDHKLQSKTMDTELVIRESCGCTCHEKTEAEIREGIEYLYMETQRNGKFNRSVRNLDDEMMECETLEELVFCIRQSMSEFIKENVYLCLNQSVYFQMTGCGNARYRKRSLVKEYEAQIYMTRICNESGMPVFEQFEREQIFPKLWNYEIEQTDNYIFVPVHFRDNCLGYLVLEGELDTDRIPNYYIWIRNISNALESLQNMLLLKSALRNIDNLSVKDSLTGVYNRTGIKRFVVDMVKQANQSNKRLLFIFADVDHLKKINDTYGHEAGDQAICMVADAIREVFGEDMIIRYGGDEFLMVTEHYANMDMDEKRTQVQELLATWAKEESIEFPLSVSIGSYCKELDTNATMEQYIEWADEKMYEIKCRNR